MSPSTENIGDEKVIHVTFQATIIIIIYLIITLIELPYLITLSMLLQLLYYGIIVQSECARTHHPYSCNTYCDLIGH